MLPYVRDKGAATGLVTTLNTTRGSRGQVLTEKRNEDGGEPQNALTSEKDAELVQVDLEDLLSQMSYAIDP